MSALTISKLAKAGGVGVETIRYYQRRGLLREPPRYMATPSGSSFRQYDQVDVDRLRFIRSAQAAGFTLDQIRELLELDGTTDRARIQELAAHRIVALDEQISQLATARQALAKLAQRCQSERNGPCPILDAFRS